MPCLPAGRKAAGSKATVVGAGPRACPRADTQVRPYIAYVRIAERLRTHTARQPALPVIGRGVGASEDISVSIRTGPHQINSRPLISGSGAGSLFLPLGYLQESLSRSRPGCPRIHNPPQPSVIAARWHLHTHSHLCLPRSTVPAPP